MSAPRRRTDGTIRGRIARTLALPVAVTLVLLGVVAAGEIGNYRDADRTDRAVGLDLAVLELVDALQAERGFAAGLLGGDPTFRARLAPARQAVDRQRAAVDELTERGGDVEDRVAAATAQLDGLAALRATTDTGDGGPADTARLYTAMISRLNTIEFGLDAVGNSELRRNYATLSMINLAKESGAQERVLLYGVFAAGRFGNGEFVQFVSAKSARDSAVLAFNQYGNPAALQAQSLVLDTPAGKQVVAMENAALAAAGGRALTVNAADWWTASGAVLDVLLQAGQDMGAVAQANAGDIKDRATVRLGVLAVLVALCLIGAVYLSLVASRWLARPLAALAGQAARIGAESLPEAVRRATAGGPDNRPPPIRVPGDATVEVRQVAEAFERVQNTAYELATEQARLRVATAESLANLGRRNQNLLRRQLGFITRLESEETSPAGLANLFELDHLATRMRRNAESLLVLVGAASPRQWTEPLPIADVIRAAVSEVEEYRRVTLRRVDDVLVNGSAVGGIAHMLAELIENGLAFSPPDVDVEIHGRVTGDGYLIAVTDSGVGMTAAEMDKANQRLRGEGDFITAPARFLGHFVVGRLAAETGVRVELIPSPITGVTARLALPSTVISEQRTVGAGGSRSLPPAPRPLRSDTIEFVVVPDGAPADPRAAAEVPPSESGAMEGAASRDGALAGAALRETGAVVGGASRNSGATGGGFDRSDVEERTPNGLRRRSPRRRRATSMKPDRAPGPRSPAAVTDSPEAVRDRLTAFRAGVSRAGAGEGGRG
ncbi:nitrate- and nitrite sensing domain-containing protein [Actinoplanes sp. NPDC000266]